MCVGGAVSDAGLFVVHEDVRNALAPTGLGEAAANRMDVGKVDDVIVEEKPVVSSARKCDEMAVVVIAQMNDDGHKRIDAEVKGIG